MSTLELRVPPPVLALVIALLMWGLTSATGSIDIPLAYRGGTALGLALFGSAIQAAAFVSLRRAKTTVDPTEPSRASTVVSTGIYSFSRNPMYIGRAVQLLAWAVFLASPFALLLVPVYLAYMARFQVVPEERALLARFGTPYESYRKRVRRWL